MGSLQKGAKRSLPTKNSKVVTLSSSLLIVFTGSFHSLFSVVTEPKHANVVLCEGFRSKLKGDLLVSVLVPRCLTEMSSVGRLHTVRRDAPFVSSKFPHRLRQVIWALAAVIAMQLFAQSGAKIVGFLVVRVEVLPP